MTIKTSICIAAYNKPTALNHTLRSIFEQEPPFDWEVIVVQDGWLADTQNVISIYQSACPNMKSYNLHNPMGYRNPCFARNMAAKIASGDILIHQSDDVIHGQKDTIERLTLNFDPEKEMHFALVRNKDFSSGREIEDYVSSKNPRRLFFLGAVSREAFYSIGGNSEDFTEPGYEDDWLGMCLERGKPHLHPVFSESILGFHQHHERPPLQEHYRKMQIIWEQKKRAAEQDPSLYVGGEPWPYVPGKSLLEAC